LLSSFALVFVPASAALPGLSLEVVVTYLLDLRQWSVKPLGHVQYYVLQSKSVLLYGAQILVSLVFVVHIGESVF
jgi:hypothetical protein